MPAAVVAGPAVARTADIEALQALSQAMIDAPEVRVVALFGDAFWDDLIAHGDVCKAADDDAGRGGAWGGGDAAAGIRGTGVSARGQAAKHVAHDLTNKSQGETSIRLQGQPASEAFPDVEILFPESENG